MSSLRVDANFFSSPLKRVSSIFSWTSKEGTRVSTISVLIARYGPIRAHRPLTISRRRGTKDNLKTVESAPDRGDKKSSTGRYSLNY